MPQEQHDVLIRLFERIVDMQATLTQQMCNVQEDLQDTKSQLSDVIVKLATLQVQNNEQLAQLMSVVDKLGISVDILARNGKDTPTIIKEVAKTTNLIKYGLLSIVASLVAIIIKIFI